MVPGSWILWLNTARRGRGAGGQGEQEGEGGGSSPASDVHPLGFEQ